jgi:hypothetical protein
MQAPVREMKRAKLVASPLVFLIRYFYCFKLLGVIWQVFARSEN